MTTFLNSPLLSSSPPISPRSVSSPGRPLTVQPPTIVPRVVSPPRRPLIVQPPTIVPRAVSPPRRPLTVQPPTVQPSTIIVPRAVSPDGLTRQSIIIPPPGLIPTARTAISSSVQPRRIELTSPAPVIFPSRITTVQPQPTVSPRLPPLRTTRLQPVRTTRPLTRRQKLSIRLQQIIDDNARDPQNESVLNVTNLRPDGTGAVKLKRFKMGQRFLELSGLPVVAKPSAANKYALFMHILVENGSLNQEVADRYINAFNGLASMETTMPFFSPVTI